MAAFQKRPWALLTAAILFGVDYAITVTATLSGFFAFDIGLLFCLIWFVWLLVDAIAAIKLQKLPAEAPADPIPAGAEVNVGAESGNAFSGDPFALAGDPAEESPETSSDKEESTRF